MGAATWTRGAPPLSTSIDSGLGVVDCHGAETPEQAMARETREECSGTHVLRFVRYIFALSVVVRKIHMCLSRHSLHLVPTRTGELHHFPGALGLGSTPLICSGADPE